MFNFDSTTVTFDSDFYEFTGDAPLSSPLCGDADALTAQAIALLPRGRAWQTDENGPRPGSILYGYWRSVAETFAFLNQRLCDLHAEFFCATRSETDAEWMAEYGLPDECDPFPDLCAKVAARGGPDCDVYKAVAAEAGWDIDCTEATETCGSFADCAFADNMIAANGPVPAVISIRVYRDTSPAYSGGLRGGAYADCLIADGILDCPPDISGLICILNRIVHAHVRVDYIVGDPRTTLTDAPITADSGISTTGEGP